MQCIWSAHARDTLPETLCSWPFPMLMTPVYSINSVHTQSCQWSRVICHSCIFPFAVCSADFVMSSQSGLICGQQNRSRGSSSLSGTTQLCKPWGQSRQVGQSKAKQTGHSAFPVGQLVLSSVITLCQRGLTFTCPCVKVWLLNITI